jgi:hypothetical protein
MMKVYAIYDTYGKFECAFPTLADAVKYGIRNFGQESGWAYNILPVHLDPGWYCKDSTQSVDNSTKT